MIDGTNLIAAPAVDSTSFILLLAATTGGPLFAVYLVYYNGLDLFVRGVALLRYLLPLITVVMLPMILPATVQAAPLASPFDLCRVDNLGSGSHTLSYSKTADCGADDFQRVRFTTDASCIDSIDLVYDGVNQANPIGTILAEFVAPSTFTITLQTSCTTSLSFYAYRPPTDDMGLPTTELSTLYGGSDEASHFMSSLYSFFTNAFILGMLMISFALFFILLLLRAFSQAQRGGG